MPFQIKPLLRAVKYSWLWRRAQSQVARPGPDDVMPDPAPIAFVIGCGRSGTTILGQVLARLPGVLYLFEPHHLWTTIDPRTDLINLFHQGDACCFMTSDDCTDEVRTRFARLFLGAGRRVGAQLVIEKMPINTLRLGYLDALAPGANYIHIARDGLDICRSIEHLATTNLYKIMGRPRLNQWWGIDGIKWEFLKRDGAKAGYFADEVELLQTDLERGAYEWLTSLGEVDRWRTQLGDRLHEITYDQLGSDPKTALSGLCKFIGIEASQSWLTESAQRITPVPSRSTSALRLPPAMCKAFNEYQERFGFSSRAQER